MKAWKRRAVEQHNATYLAKQQGVELTAPPEDIVAIGIDPGSETQEVVTVDNKGKIGIVGGGIGFTPPGRAIMRQLAIQKLIGGLIETTQVPVE